MSYFSAIGKFCLYVNAAMICDLLTVMTMTTICASSLMPDAVVAPITLSPRLHHKASKSSFNDSNLLSTSLSNYKGSVLSYIATKYREVGISEMGLII